MDMRWKVQWKDVTITSTTGSMTSGFSKSKFTEESLQVALLLKCAFSGSFSIIEPISFFFFVFFFKISQGH